MKPLEQVIDALDEAALVGLTEYLESFVTQERLTRIDRALGARTRRITVVLEDLYRMHNASAVVRSCECFGIQEIHVVESDNVFEVNRSIVQGAAKWVTVRRHPGRDGIRRCLSSLKKEGYLVAAMSPRPGGTPVERLCLERPLALCFGSEEPGLSQQAMDMADVTATIPMQGFTQSLNLSVSAGIALYLLGERLRGSDLNWRIDGERYRRLRALWLARSINAGRQIVGRYLSAPPK